MSWIKELNAIQRVAIQQECFFWIQPLTNYRDWLELNHLFTIVSIHKQALEEKNPLIKLKMENDVSMTFEEIVYLPILNNHIATSWM